MHGSTHSRGDDGVALILALIFIVAVGLVGVSLASATGSDLLNASNAKVQRSIEYAADGATTLAVQTVRYSGNQYSSTPTECLPGGAPISFNGVMIAVYCTQVSSSFAIGASRVIDFMACATASCTSNTEALEAVVTYDDFSPTNAYMCSYPSGPFSTCGSSVAIDSWIVKSANN